MNGHVSNCVLTGGPTRQVPGPPDPAELARSSRVEGWAEEASRQLLGDPVITILHVRIDGECLNDVEYTQERVRVKGGGSHSVAARMEHPGSANLQGNVVTSKQATVGEGAMAGNRHNYNM